MPLFIALVLRLKECLSSKMMVVPKPTENLWTPSAFVLFLHTFLPDSLHTERWYTRNSPRRPLSKPLCCSNPAHSSGCKWSLLPSIIIDLPFDPSSIYSTQSPEYIPSYPVHLCVCEVMIISLRAKPIVYYNLPLIAVSHWLGSA